MDKKNKIIVKNYVYTLGYQIVTYLVPMIVTPHISRVFGPEGVGVQSYVNAVTTYFTMFAMLGTSIYAAREIAQCRDDKSVCSLKFWEIFLLKVITTILSLIAWGVFFFVTTKYRSFYIAASVQILATIFDISWFFEGHERMDIIAIRNIIIKLLNLVFVFTVIKKADDLWLYILSIGVFTLLGNGSLWVSLKKYLIPIDFRTLNIGRHVKDTLVYFVPTFATLIYTVLDKVMIGVITENEAENGFYEQAERIINVGKNLVCTLPNVIAARISYLFAVGDNKEIKSKVKFTIDFYWFAAIPVTIGLIGISHYFVPWYFGKGFEQVEYLIDITSWLILIVGGSAVLGRAYLTPSGQRARSTKAIIAGAVCNFILNLILIPRFASFGAAIASVAGEIVVTTMYLYMCKEFIGAGEFFFMAWKKALAAGVMFVIIQLGIWGRIASSWRITLIQMIVGAVIYFAVLIALRDELVIRLLRAIRSKL